MEQKLCTSCQQIIDSFSEFVDAMDIPHGSVAQVISNAERGCLICALIRNTLGKEKAQVFGSYQYEIQTTLTMSSIGTAFIELNINSKAPSTQLPEIGLMSEDMEMQFQKIAAEPSEQVRGVWPSFVNGGLTQQPNLPRYTDDEPTWNIVQKWIQDCGNTQTPQHAHCVKGSPSFLPTRLIYVRSDNDQIRLCDTSSLNSNVKVQYLTLSHCWGKRPMPLVTTAFNINEMMVGVSFDNLTKSFQQAITTTRRLGHNYIWIDSLCIIQGDASDWAREAKLMSSVYAGGIVNLVAAAAADGTIGLFFNRPVNDRVGCTLQLANGQYSFCWPSNAAPAIVLGPLSCETAKRAWCFQERLLSSRNLFFSEHQVYWDCGGLFASESYPDREPSLSDLYPVFEDSATSVSWMKDPDELVGFWLTIVYTFTHADLTYHRDKLFTIAGCARMLFEHMRDLKIFPRAEPRLDFGKDRVYFAGLWRWDMYKQLSWHLDVGDGRPRPNDKGFQAPSWSWASVSSPVYYNLRNGKVLATVLQAACNLCTADEFGGVDGGELILNCRSPLVKISVKADWTISFSVGSLQNHSEHRALWDTSEIYSGEAFLFPVTSYHPLILVATGEKNTFRRIGILEWEGYEFVEEGYEFEIIIV